MCLEVGLLDTTWSTLGRSGDTRVRVTGSHLHLAGLVRSGHSGDTCDGCGEVLGCPCPPQRCDDGTVSRCTGVKLKFGLAKTHQTLMLNGSADVSLETDGHVVNVLMMAAELMRVLMAKLGFNSVVELIGHAERGFGRGVGEQ